MTKLVKNLITKKKTFILVVSKESGEWASILEGQESNEDLKLRTWIFNGFFGLAIKLIRWPRLQRGNHH